MENIFEESVYREISYRESGLVDNVIRAEDVKLIGVTKIDVEEDVHEGVKIILKKDINDNIKEIKFVCSCGETKSVLLDYSDE